MKVNNARLVISAVSQRQYPGDHLPEIALAGRSNVGKSSFINKLIQRKSLARTSSKPGKTQTLNFYNINEMFYFVDVPGYSYAKISKVERKKWGNMMEEYFQTRDCLKAVILVTDSRHAPTQDDIQMYEYLKFYNLPVAIIATKVDKVSRSKREKYLKRTRQTLKVESDDLVIPFSAETGEGKEKLWTIIKKYINS